MRTHGMYYIQNSGYYDECEDGFLSLDVAIERAREIAMDMPSWRDDVLYVQMAEEHENGVDLMAADYVIEINDGHADCGLTADEHIITE